MGFFYDMKTCTKCKVDKELTDFNKDNSIKSGYRSTCKECCNKYRLDNSKQIKESNKQYRLNNKEKINECNKKYYLNNKHKKKEYNEINKEKLTQYHKQYYLDNKEFIDKKHKQYVLDNKEKLKENKTEYFNKYYLKNKDKAKKYALDNKEKISKYRKNYWLKNKEKINKRNRDRKETDGLFKLTCSIRNLIYISIKKQGYSKKSKTFKILGCTIEEFKVHLENKFVDGMTWDNQGEWHLDHIYPVSLAKDEEELIKLNHYTNFQPLWALDNIRKSNKINN